MKKKPDKKTLLVVGALVLSLGFNLYFFGYKGVKGWEKKVYGRGKNAVVSTILRELQQNGEVAINIGGNKIVLVPKIVTPAEKEG
jgi:hypothetical protein